MNIYFLIALTFFGGVLFGFVVIQFILVDKILDDIKEQIRRDKQTKDPGE